MSGQKASGGSGGAASVSVITWLPGLLDNRGKKKEETDGVRPDQPGPEARGSPKTSAGLIYFLTFFKSLHCTDRSLLVCFNL